MLSSSKSTANRFQQPLALVIDGKSLSFSLELEKNPFLQLALRCDTVICCRVSPMQKVFLFGLELKNNWSQAQVVRMVKKDNKSNVTLSIGDGANDVSMIQEADVGIGKWR